MKAKSWAAALWILIMMVGTTGCACGRWVGPGHPHGYIVDQWPSLADWLDEHGPTGCHPLLHRRPD
jgi:hypothetical protein